MPAARATWARLRKAKPRARRYGLAASKLAGSTRFYQQAINPAVSFGTEAFGVSEHFVRAARGLACHAAGLFLAGACTTACLALAPGGSRADPAVALRVGLIASWLRLWGSLEALDQASIQAVWRKIAGESPPRGCAQSREPISATIHALRWAGWRPLAAARWQEP